MTYEQKIKDFQMLEPIRFGEHLDYWQDDICINNVDNVVIDIEGSLYFNLNGEELPDTVSWLNGEVMFYNGDDPIAMVCVDNGSTDSPVFKWLKKEYNFDVTQTAYEQL